MKTPPLHAMEKLYEGLRMQENVERKNYTKNYSFGLNSLCVHNKMLFLVSLKGTWTTTHCLVCSFKMEIELLLLCHCTFCEHRRKEFSALQGIIKWEIWSCFFIEKKILKDDFMHIFCHFDGFLEKSKKSSRDK